MLLRFAVSNFLSIRDEQELSMIASGAIKDDVEGLIATAAVRNEKVLPAAVIYGANASGKSNVVQALRFMRRMVLESHNKLGPGAGVPRKAFRLDPACRNADSKFEIDFIAGGVRHQYGFTANDEKFTGEWLYAWPKGVRSLLFSRVDQNFSFGRMLKGENEVISNLTRSNSLFISAAAQNNHALLSPLSGFFQAIFVEWTDYVSPEAQSRIMADIGLDARGMKILGALDTGVVTFKVDLRHGPDLRAEIIRNLTQHTGSIQTRSVTDAVQKITPAEIKSAQFGHAAAGGGVEFFDLASESTGTLRLSLLFWPIFRALDNGLIAVIDELDSSLHTRACEALIQLFNSPETNPNGAQLIATTHDTNLLNAELLRRDQIWFTQKDKVGATHLYPLTDIRTRKGDNIEKGYLQGRFGAIPFAGSISKLLRTG